jgi:CRISPR-associated protein Csm2
MPETRTRERKGFSFPEAKKRLKDLENLGALDGQELVVMTRAIGERCVRVSANQIRKFHEHIVRYATSVEAKRAEVRNVKLLSYHLAYAAARIRKNEERELMKELAEFLDVALDKVKTMQDLARLRQLSEAIVAYHKFFGGRDS